MYEAKLVGATLSGGTAYANANAPQSMPRLDALASQLANLRDSAMSVADRSRQVTERLLGTQPEKVSPNSAEPPPACKVRELEVICVGIQDYLANAHAQLDRLESL